MTRMAGSVAQRWWSVLRYHRPSQLALRLVSRAERKRLQLTRGGKYARREFPIPEIRVNAAWKELVDKKLAERTSAAERAALAAAGRFRFLNQTQFLPRPINWDLKDQPGLSHLWR